MSYCLAVKTATAAREAELRALDLLGQPMPDVLRRIVRVAAQVTGARSAEINIITGTAQHTLASTGAELSSCREEDSFCARIIEQPERDHLVPDAGDDERFKDNPLTKAGVVLTYAASQLVTPNDVPIGTLCVYDPERKDIDTHMMRVLSELSEAAMDVLEARRQHQELESSLTQLTDGQRELRRSNEHLAAFAGQVSHDIQGPLAGVVLALQLLEDEVGEVPEANRGHHAMVLRRALSSAERMGATVNGLMDYATLGGTLTPYRLDMNRVLKDATADLALGAGEAQIIVEELPEVWGDEVQVRAVVQNLLSNALKYAGHVPNPKAWVDGTANGDRVRIRVSDNGPGVPVTDRDVIFGLLVRGADSEDSAVEGLGIGLATCRRIIQAHGGTIGVTDSETGGASFWFELPLP